MHYIIFGAGEVGIKAWFFLQNDCVKCFVDNYKAGQKMYATMGTIEVEKDIIDFPAMMEIYNEGQTIVVVASGNYSQEMVSQLLEAGGDRYFVFSESDTIKIWPMLPYYRLYRRWEHVSYTKRLFDHNISVYKNVAILGANEFLPYLISAIAFQAGFEHIIGVIDTPEAHEANKLGLPLIDWEEAKRKIDCLVVNSHRADTYYCDELEECEHDFHILRLFEVEQEMPMFFHPELKKYKGIHKGKRCFVLGNGPSLTVEDLEVLHDNNEICIGCNKVYRIYPKTKWRADYLMVTDHRVIEEMRKDNLEDVPGVKFIADQNHRENEFLLDGFEPVHFFEEAYYPRNYPKFSDDITKGVYLGWTVIYDMSLQFAAYMGFDEIYILGVDLSFTKDIGKKEEHFINGYIKEEDRHLYKNVGDDVSLPRIVRAFEKAEKYSRQHGFRIYNATRGGNLEAFERIEFDKLF
ncbi:6-hydroxymethylpterin diphosphokinase MptE-like protein [Selenomonas ruminantium]|uniref:6-hydroxymethylpterin diphosphokinase MptE-like domain-containing protein n=1 Tax=Selenomonas ruminantium TaxID=971 RepID=A0A1H0S2H1_SELRU|nr:6-hydroxymethylpterin diphosphokinase MptE-like protein [Selenomonas ruminantium]SDP35446.1 Protein of unknown function DUF115 [Selenomonas ruminantium]